jgi:hypothetical protein
MMDFRDELFFMLWTIVQEGGAEPFDGQLGIGYVIMNRSASITDTVFRAYQFSAWNTDSATRMNLDIVPDIILMQCYKATVAAYFKLLPDPTKGATHYLNEELTRKMRGGTLPSWFDEEKVTARIGKHTFLKLE